MPATSYNSFVAPTRRITRLNQALADQIAAGEVVERPASVVKELVENSIDAGALRVDIELEDGGLTCIRVRDNGRGIHPDDLPLTIVRHATSKLTGPEDLVEIQTLGFRGEALASVAAVANLCVRSRQPDAPVGVELRSVPADEPRLTPSGMPVGTQVEIRGLFASVPARRKFLRSEATEVGHCSEAVIRMALVHPDVHFTLRHGRRELLNLRPGSEDERVQQILQRRGRGPFFRVEGEDQGVAVRAWFSRPEAAVRGRSAAFIVVRRRVVRERSISQIINQAYGDALPAGKSPVACVFVEPPRATVDVNVHPQKAEVRFSEPQRVYASLRRVLARELARAPWVSGGAAPEASTPEQAPRAAPERSSPDAPRRELDGAQQDELLDMFSGPSREDGALRDGEPVRAAVAAWAGHAVEAGGSSAATRSNKRANPGAGRVDSPEPGPGPGDPDVDAARPTARARSGAYRLSTRALTTNYGETKQALKQAAAAIGVSREPLDRAERGASPTPTPTPTPTPIKVVSPAAPVADPEWRAAEPRELLPASSELEAEAPVEVDVAAAGPMVIDVEDDASASLPQLLTCLPGPVALFEIEESLLAVDLRQLRAHLVYRRLARDIGGRGGVAVQRLLSPVIARRGRDEVTLCVSAREELLELGIDLDAFGDDAIVVRGVPAHLRNCIDDADVTDLIERVIPWLRLRTREAGDVSAERAQQRRREVLTAIAETRGGDPAPRLARRWIGELLELGDSIETVPGVRRWTASALVRPR